MAKELSGTGRVTVFSVLHDWPNNFCVLAHATTGNGDTAVLGVIPVEGNEFEPGDLFAMAGRNRPESLYGSKGPDHARAAWLACLGFSARLCPKPDTIDIPEAAWSLDMSKKVTMADTLFTYSHVAAGRFTFDDPALMDQARAILPSSMLRTRSASPDGRDLIGSQS